MTDPSPNQQQPHDAELLALQCVGYMKDFINVLRSIPEFDGMQQQKRMIHQHSNRFNHEDFENLIVTVPLYTRIQETTSLCQNIHELYANANKTVRENNTTSFNFWNIPHWDKESSSSATMLSSERSQLLHHVLLPLVASLGMCYEVLDRIPTPSLLPPPPPPDTPTSSKSTKTLKPIPPIGMLSLQNYTDIAGLMEFIICTCVVPMIPPNILTSIHDRVRYHLPKTLAGRIPRWSLLWSSQYHQKQHDKDSATLVREWDSVVCILGRLLLLDRFRPMLLPRHVTDIMAIILFRQEFCNNDNIDTPYTLIANRWIGNRTSRENIAPSHDEVPVVDTYWRVKAYQAVLRNGRAAPVWIRRTVAPLLTQVATVDLSVLITVFVHEAVDQDYSSAALRIAQALVPKNTMSAGGPSDDTKVTASNDEYLSALCEQLVDQLDACSLNAATDNISVQNGATIETIWAVLDILPKPLIDVKLFQALILNDMNIRRSSQGDGDLYDSDLHKITRRLITLFSIVPSNVGCVTSICYLFLRPLNFRNCGVSLDELLQVDESFLLGVIIRLSSSTNVLQSTVKNDAILMLNLFFNAMVNSQIGTTTARDSAITRCDVLVAALLRSVTPYSFDSELLSFDSNCLEECQGAALQPVRLRKLILSDDAKMEFYVKGIEDRVQLILRVLLMNSRKDADGIERNTVLSVLFQTLLTAYFCPNAFDSDSEVPSMFRDKMFKIATMVSLPLICEECPPEILLSIDNDTNIFIIMRIVIDSAMTHCSIRQGEPNEITMQQRDTHPNTALLSQRIIHADSVAFPHFQHHDARTIDEDLFASPDDDMIVSMTSVILGLLISILELGAKNRSVEQEAILKSFIPDLLAIADSSTSISGGNSNLVQAFAQIADLASLAAASIATRQVPIENEETKRVDHDSSMGYLQDAERDVLSDLPPIRARAMIQLRHRVVEIAETLRQHDPINAISRDDDDLFQILLICIKALNDKESYVYLAAIHTIVAVADSDPSKFVRVIGIALVTGFVNSQDSGESMYEMNLEQRAKLTEALVFVVRRRNTFYPMLPFLIDLLVIGLQRGEERLDEQVSKSIHVATHRYFVTGTYIDIQNDNDDGEFERSLDDYWKEVDIRVRTGGPLFQMENADVVRSGMILVVSDLVSILSPSVTAPYALILISCCIDTLRLDASRPVRRAGATLARELYGSLVREQDEFLDAVSNMTSYNVVLSMAMAEGREEVLYSVLRRIVAHGELSVQLNGMERLDDPALKARCQEATASRNNADQGGILLAGKVALKAREHDDNIFVARLLHRNNNNAPVPKLKIQELD